MYQEEALKDVLPIQQCYDYIIAVESRREVFNRFVAELNRFFPTANELDAVSLVLLYIIDGMARQSERAMIKYSPLGRTLTDLVQAISEEYNKDTLCLNNTTCRKGQEESDKQALETLYKQLSPELTEKLGIIYTPDPVVHCILHAVETVLRNEFGTCLSNENVTIIDPCCGVGVFVSNMLQLGLIKEEDLERKLKNEIFCNDILLYSSFVSKMNLEEYFYKTTGRYQELNCVACCNALEGSLESTLHEGDDKRGEEEKKQEECEEEKDDNDDDE